jgi:2-methylcitrate dehydratase PrpD
MTQTDERVFHTTIFQLSHFFSQIKSKDLPDSARRMARLCILDLIAAAIPGFRTTSAEAARKFAYRFFPTGPCTVWFSRRCLNPAGAAMANSVAASALDLDDGNRSACGHPGAAIIPAAMALVESLAKRGVDFLSAVVIGYEIAVRISAARELSALDTLSTGRWCGFGAAAAAAWLKKADEIAMANALAIAGIHSPIQSANSYSQTGHHTKEGIPWGTLTGLAALELAESGFCGPLDILDHNSYYDHERILDGLGEKWAIEETYFKPYSCCRWIHAAVDGLIELMIEYRLDANDIQKAEVHTFKRACSIKNEADPASLEAAQYSIPFCMALAAIEGTKALLPVDPNLLGRRDIVEWARMVRIVFDEEIEAFFPAKTAARIVLLTRFGSIERLIKHPKGDPTNPLTESELMEKLRQLATDFLPPKIIDRLLHALSMTEKNQIEELLRTLKGLQ